MENSKSLAEKVGYLIGIIMLCFASAGFLMWGMECSRTAPEHAHFHILGDIRNLHGT